MKKVITPVGLSVFENFFKRPRNNELREAYEKFKNDSLKYPASKYDEYHDDPYFAALKDEVTRFAKGTEDASAEITSLLKIIKEKREEKIEVYFLVTDTILSLLAANILKEKFAMANNSGIIVQKIEIIADLQVEDATRFKTSGLINLVSAINAIIEDDYKEVIFNITGGYKAVIPYLTIMAQLNEIPSYYIFEEMKDKELLEIPFMPLDFDFSIIEDNYLAFESFKKQEHNWLSPENFKRELNQNPSQAEKEFRGLQEEYQLVEIVDGKVRLTVLGRMLVDKYDKLVNEDRLDRNKIIGKLVELKLYQYYASELTRSANVIPGESIGVSKFDIDVYIEEDKGTITAIEVKSGANPPLFMREKASHKTNKQTIEHKLTQGGFHELLQNKKDRPLNLMVVLYHHKDVDPRNIEKIKLLHKKYPELTGNLGWYLLRLSSDYKMKENWAVNNRLIHIYGKQLIIGG